MNRATKSSDYIYLFMALFFVLTAVAGFIPTSFGLISRVASGQQPLPPFIVHFHAASFSLWLILLLAQSTLMYIKRPSLHKKLGLISFILAPCILISMIGIEIYYVENVLAPSDSSLEQAAEYKRDISNILLIHGVSYLFFPSFYLWAILVRQKDSESHKRLMNLATQVLMIPALGRLIGFSQVLPDLGLNTIDARHFYMLLLIVPAVVYDIAKNGTLHRSYSIGLAFIGLWVVTAHYLWGSTWWINTAAKLFGV